MKLAVLSDIHANDAALEAVLSEARKEAVSKLLLLGDYVGYFYNPKRVLGLLSTWDKVMIKGNHELYLEFDAEKRASMIKKYGHGLEVAFQELSTRQIKHLINLPENVKISIDGLSFLLCHGSALNIDEYVYPDAPSEVLDRCAQGADFVLQGHTHHPFIYVNGSVTLCNPGSVGQPRDYAAASWALIDTTTKAVTLKRTEFDRQRCINDILNYDPDKGSLIKVMKRGYEVE